MAASAHRSDCRRCNVANLVLYHCAVPAGDSDVAPLQPSRIARYVNVEIWARCLTLGTLAGGLIGGGVNYAMFSRERAARIAAEIVAEEERKRAAEERKRVDQLIVQFGETQQAMMSAITALTAEVAELRRQRTNGADSGR